MKSEIRYGLYGAAGIIAWELGEYALGLHGEKLKWGMVSSFLFIIIPAIAIFFGLKERRKELDGFLTLRQGIKSGFLISLVFAGVASVFMYFYVSSINPDFIDNRLEFQREMAFERFKLDDPERSDTQAIRMAKEQFPDTDVVQVVLSYWLVRLCGGLLIGLVITAILRREPIQVQLGKTQGPPGNGALQDE